MQVIKTASPLKARAGHTSSVDPYICTVMSCLVKNYLFESNASVSYCVTSLFFRIGRVCATKSDV